MFFLLRNFLRQDMHKPESHDSNDWRDDQHDPGDAVGNRVQRLAVEKRGLRPAWQRQAGKYDQPSEPRAGSMPRVSGTSDDYVLCFTFHEWFFRLYKSPNS